MRKKIFILLIVIVLLFEASVSFAELTDASQLFQPLSNDNQVTLEFAFSFDTNLIFQKYDVSMYVDNNHITDLHHGQGYQGRIKVSPGKHKLCFYKYDDKKTYGIFEFDVYEYTFIVGSIHTRYSRIDVSKLETQARYDLVSGENLDTLKEYDTVMNNLNYYFDIAFSCSGKTGRQTGHYIYYYLFSTKEQTYLFFGKSSSPAGTASVHRYGPEFGTYSGDISTGNIILMSSSSTKEVKDFNYDDDTLHETDFQNACENYMQICIEGFARRCFLLEYDLQKYQPIYYRLIFPNGN